MPCGVPRQVIVDHHVEMFLEVDSLGQTVRAYQNRNFFGDSSQLFNSEFSFFRGKRAGNSLNLCVSDFPTKLLDQIINSRNEATKNNRTTLIFDLVLEELNQGFEFMILLSRKFFSVFRKCTEFILILV